jgi:hypothetical protein
LVRKGGDFGGVGWVKPLFVGYRMFADYRGDLVEGETWVLQRLNGPETNNAGLLVHVAAVG